MRIFANPLSKKSCLNPLPQVQSMKQKQLVEKASSIAAAAAAASSSSTEAAAAADSSTGDSKRQPATRPGSLPMPYRNGPSSSASSGDIADAASSAEAAAAGGGPLSLTSFPTPMEEPRKAIKVRRNLDLERAQESCALDVFQDDSARPDSWPRIRERNVL